MINASGFVFLRFWFISPIILYARERDTPQSCITRVQETYRVAFEFFLSLIFYSSIKIIIKYEHTFLVCSYLTYHIAWSKSRGICYCFLFLVLLRLQKREFYCYNIFNSLEVKEYMAYFRKVESKDASKYMSECSIGGKIRRYRELNGMTQQELGIKAGFSKSTAGIRVGQYELNRKTPKEDIINALADGLGIEKAAIFGLGLDSPDVMFQVMFELERIYGLQPVKYGNDYFLEFNEQSLLNDESNLRIQESHQFLKEWYEAREKFTVDMMDYSPELLQKKKNEYDQWRAHYPSNVYGEKIDHVLKREKMMVLSQEIDKLNEEANGKNKENDLINAITPYIESVKEQFKPLKSESEFILFLEKMMETGLNIKNNSPEWVNEDKDYQPFLAVKIDEILDTVEKKKIFAEFMCILEDFQTMGLDIIRKTVSRDKELYLVFKYSMNDAIYFNNLDKSWDLIETIAQRKRDDCPIEEYELEKNKLDGIILGKGKNVYYKYRIDKP